MLSEDVEPSFMIFFLASRYSSLARARTRKVLKNKLSPELSFSIQIFDLPKRINFVRYALPFSLRYIESKKDRGFSSGKTRFYSLYRSDIRDNRLDLSKTER